MLEGPSAVTFVDGDPVAAAKSVVDAAKKFPTLVLKGGYHGRQACCPPTTPRRSPRSSRREVMLSKIAGLMKSEMSKAAALFVGAQSKFLSLLEAYKAKLPAEDRGRGRARLGRSRRRPRSPRTPRRPQAELPEDATSRQTEAEASDEEEGVA